MKSLKTKFFIIFMTAVLVILAVALLMHNIFFKSYVISRDKAVFRSVEEEMSEAFEKGSLDIDYIQNISYRFGIQMDVVDKRSNEILLSSNNLFRNKMRGKDVLPREVLIFDYSDESRYGFYQLEAGEGEVLISIGSLDEERALVLYKPVAIIDRTVVASNRFIFLLVGLLMIPAGLLIYYLVKRQVDPIIELHAQTEKMAKLDFSQRSNLQGSDEITELGRNINAISDKLSETINTLEDDVRKLTEVDRVRKNFIATISHEFKTPLGLIKGYTESLKYDLVDAEDIDKYHNIILDETDRLSYLVKDLVHLMQRDLGQKPLLYNEVKLKDFLVEILEKHRHLHPSYAYDLNCPEDLHLSLDEKAITQVMDNFLSNAFFYGEKDSQISIDVTKQEKDVTINIFNRGNPIPEDQKEKIWESFYKVDKARTREDRGTGLGLSINKSIIEAHGGNYGFKNGGDGVTFYFSLPK